MLVSSVPLSLTIECGRPRWKTMLSSSRATRMPDSDVSAHQRQAFPAEVVDDREDAEAAAIGEAVGEEVQAPALVRSLRDRHGCACAQRPLAATAPADLQPFLACKSERASCGSS